MKISKNKKMRFFLMSQGSLNPQIRFLGQKMWPVARSQTHRHTDAQTDGRTHRVTTEGTLSGFQDFFRSAYHQGSAQPQHRNQKSLEKKVFWKFMLYTIITIESIPLHVDNTYSSDYLARSSLGKNNSASTRRVPPQSFWVVPVWGTSTDRDTGWWKVWCTWWASTRCWLLVT